jgi:DNA transposition AAA+ family ATPase
MAKPDFARRVGASDNLLYKLYTGKYRDENGKQLFPSPELIKNIQTFLALEKERFESGETEFVITPTAKKIFSTCALARESQTPAIMWGPSQIGKTWALRNVKTTNNHGRTFMAELDASSGLGGMVRCIAQACGISDKSNTAALVERIKGALTPDTLLIIDEVHLLKHTYRLNSFFACIETIRRIYDKTRCGMVLSWTEIKELKQASAGELVQVWRRGVHKVALPVMPTKADLAAIFEHAGLDFPDKALKFTFATQDEKGNSGSITETPYEIVRQLAKLEGLKAITERLRYARKIALKSKDKVTWRHFTDAHLRIAKQAQQEGEWN